MLSSLAVVRDAPKPITEVRPGASRELQRIIDRCLEKDPERRLQSASELRGLLGALALPSARPAARRMPVAVAAVIVIGLIAAALLLTRTRDRDAGNLPEPTFTRVTFEPRIESWPSLSPDGTELVYTGQSAGNTDVYIHRLGDPTERTVSDLWPSDHAGVLARLRFAP